MTLEEPDSAQGNGAPRLFTFLDRHHRAALAAVLLIALVLRGAALWSYAGSLYADFLFGDERTHDAWAREIVAGKPLYLYSVSPLPAYVLAGVYWLFGTDPLHGRVLNVLLDVAACGLLYAVSRRLGGRAAGVLTAAVAALYGPFVLMSVTILKEPLGSVLFALLLLLLLDEWDAFRWWRALLLGVVGGALLEVRPNTAAVMAVVLVALAARRVQGGLLFRARRVGLVACGLVAATLPFTIANYRGTGALSPVPTGGFEFYLGNHLDGSERPYYSPVRFATASPSTHGVQFTIEASHRLGRDLSLSESSAYWTGEVVKQARARPGEFGKRLFRKALVVFHRSEEADNQSIRSLRHHVPFFRIPLLAFWLVMPLGMAGLFASASRDPRARTLLAVVLVYCLTMIAVFSNMRIRLPLLLVLIPYAVLGLRSLLQHDAWTARTATGYAVLVLAFGALANVPVPGAGDLSGSHNDHAAALFRAGRTDEAARELEESIARGGHYAEYAKLSLAGLRMLEDDEDGARALLDTIPDDGELAAAKQIYLGDLARWRNDLAGAAAAYERAVSIHRGDVMTRRKLIDVLATVAPERVPVEQAELERVLRFYGPLVDWVVPRPES